MGVALATLPVLAVSSGVPPGSGSPTVSGTESVARAHRVARGTGWDGGTDRPARPELAPTVLPVLRVDGSLPQPPDLRTLFVRPPPSGSLGVPVTALRAYQQAAARLRDEQPGCHIGWELIAGIGRIESNHARGGYVDATGDTVEPIRGPVLDGSGSFAAIPDTDDGRLDGNTRWDRAVGPMQFLPSTWQRYGADANGDGVADPDNIYDAALAAARYLCAGDVDLADPRQLRAAVFRYNHSVSYVSEVLAWAEAYRTGVRSVPDSDVPLAVPAPVVRAAAGPVPDPPEPSQGAATTSSAPSSTRDETPRTIPATSTPRTPRTPGTLATPTSSRTTNASTPNASTTVATTTTTSSTVVATTPTGTSTSSGAEPKCPPAGPAGETSSTTTVPSTTTRRSTTPHMRVTPTGTPTASTNTATSTAPPSTAPRCVTATSGREGER